MHCFPLFQELETEARPRGRYLLVRSQLLRCLTRKNDDQHSILNAQKARPLTSRIGTFGFSDHVTQKSLSRPALGKHAMRQHLSSILTYNVSMHALQVLAAFYCLPLPPSETLLRTRKIWHQLSASLHSQPVSLPRRHHPIYTKRYSPEHISAGKHYFGAPSSAAFAYVSPVVAASVWQSSWRFQGHSGEESCSGRVRYSSRRRSDQPSRRPAPKCHDTRIRTAEAWS